MARSLTRWGITRGVLLAVVCVFSMSCGGKQQQKKGKGKAKPVQMAAEPMTPTARLKAPVPPARRRAAALPKYEGRVKAITGVTVIGGVRPYRIAKATVLIEGGVIKAVGVAGKVQVPAGAVRIDGTGKYLMPGLVDGHIHFFQSGGLFTRPDGLDLRHRVPYEGHQQSLRRNVGEVFKQYLANGVTTVIDVGGPFWNFEVRDKARAAGAVAPRVFVTGPLIASYEPAPLAAEDRGIIKVTNVAEALALTKRELAKKPDFIKLWYVVSKKAALSRKAFFPVAKAVADAAHKAGVPVYIHATEPETAKLAMRAGADVLVHNVFGKAVDDEFIKLAKDGKVILVPTLWVFSSYATVYKKQFVPTAIEQRLGDPFVIGSLLRMRELGVTELGARQLKLQAEAGPVAPRPFLMENLKRLSDAGVMVAMGTDAGNVGVLHGPSIHRELALMHQAGLSRRQVLVAATRTAARLVRRGKLQGSVAPGMVADLLLLDGDPEKDLNHLKRIRLVMKGGRVWRPAELIDRRPRALAQRQLNAYNSRDLERFLAVYHPQVEIFDFPGGALKMKGLPAMRKAYATLFSKAPTLHCQLVSRIVQGRFVFDREHVTGIPGRSPLEATAIYEIADGLIRRVWFVK